MSGYKVAKQQFFMVSHMRVYYIYPSPRKHYSGGKRVVVILPKITALWMDEDENDYDVTYNEMK